MIEHGNSKHIADASWEPLFKLLGSAMFGVAGRCLNQSVEKTDPMIGRSRIFLPGKNSIDSSETDAFNAPRDHR
jgi:hypothetical protein